jgi:hypothetical protein
MCVWAGGYRRPPQMVTAFAIYVYGRAGVSTHKAKRGCDGGPHLAFAWKAIYECHTGLSA